MIPKKMPAIKDFAIVREEYAIASDVLNRFFNEAAKTTEGGNKYDWAQFTIEDLLHFEAASALSQRIADAAGGELRKRHPLDVFNTLDRLAQEGRGRYKAATGEEAPV